MMHDDPERARERARQYGREYVDLTGFRVPDEMLSSVPVELMFRYNFVPLEKTRDGKLSLAIADPSQLLMIDELRLLLRRPIEVKVSSLSQIDEALKKTGDARRGN